MGKVVRLGLGGKERDWIGLVSRTIPSQDVIESEADSGEMKQMK